MKQKNVLERPIIILEITPTRTLSTLLNYSIEMLLQLLNQNSEIQYKQLPVKTTKGAKEKMISTNTHIRIQLSNYLVQATFTSFETMATVYHFINGILTEEAKNNYILFTTPPKKIHKNEPETLIDLGLIPNALLFFDSKTKIMPEIRTELIAKYLCKV